MSSTTATRSAIAAIYAAAIVISIFVGGLVWVAVIGAIVAGLAYRFLAGPPPAGTGRNRQRNRNRNRT